MLRSPREPKDGLAGVSRSRVQPRKHSRRGRCVDPLSAPPISDTDVNHQQQDRARRETARWGAPGPRRSANPKRSISDACQRGPRRRPSAALGPRRTLRVLLAEEIRGRDAATRAQHRRTDRPPSGQDVRVLIVSSCSRSTSATRTAPGNAARTRTNGLLRQYFPTTRSTPPTTSTPSPPSSTTDPASD